jgi:hypothetical protein
MLSDAGVVATLWQSVIRGSATGNCGQNLVAEGIWKGEREARPRLFRRDGGERIGAAHAP